MQGLEDSDLVLGDLGEEGGVRAPHVHEAGAYRALVGGIHAPHVQHDDGEVGGVCALTLCEAGAYAVLVGGVQDDNEASRGAEERSYLGRLLEEVQRECTREGSQRSYRGRRE